jgi:hypothetical protein
MVTPKRCWLEYQGRSASHLKQSTLSRQKRASEGGAPQIPTCLVKAWRGESGAHKRTEPLREGSVRFFACEVMLQRRRAAAPVVAPATVNVTTDSAG